MVNLETLKKDLEKQRQVKREAYEEVCQIRRGETSIQSYRREVAELKWLADFLLETDFVLRNCVFDEEKLRRPSVVGSANSINGGYSLGFDIPQGIVDGSVNFNLYVMHLHEMKKEIFQCPGCRLVYSMPREIYASELLKIREIPKPFRIGRR